MRVDIGISESERAKIAEGLSKLLADSYTLYMMTHNFHWNVTGPMFDTLHKLFEEHYTELWGAVDLIAERIRVIGFPAPGTYKQFAELSTIKETEGVPDANEMIKILVAGNEAVAKTARNLLDIVGDAKDESTQGMLGDRIDIHEKNAWMLRSLL